MPFLIIQSAGTLWTFSLSGAVAIHSFQARDQFARRANAARCPGTEIAGVLEDESIVEVILYPDGRLWIGRLSSGLIDTGKTLIAAAGERIVRLMAPPRVSTELPGTGARFER